MFTPGQTKEDFLRSLPRKEAAETMKAFFLLINAEDEQIKRTILNSTPEKIQENIAAISFLSIQEGLIEGKAAKSRLIGKEIKRDALRILVARIAAQPSTKAQDLVDDAVKAAQKLHDIC